MAAPCADADAVALAAVAQGNRDRQPEPDAERIAASGQHRVAHHTRAAAPARMSPTIAPAAPA